MADSLIVGWNPDLDIPAALELIHEAQCDAPYALVSMVDSTPRVRTLPSVVPMLDRLKAFHTEIDFDVVMELRTLISLAGTGDLLSGFDEVWLCTAVPTAGKPEHVRMTSDTPLGVDPPSGLAEWMRGAGCCVGLGDGVGLNFATFAPDLAPILRS